jgi:DNA-binding transcriptional LysR family regulator
VAIPSWSRSARRSKTNPSAGLNAGEVDAAFVMPPITHQGLRFETLWSAPRVAVLPSAHPLAARPPDRAGPLVEEFVALARRVRFAVGLAGRLGGH